jgi:hypothetical protein
MEITTSNNSRYSLLIRCCEIRVLFPWERFGFIVSAFRQCLPNRCPANGRIRHSIHTMFHDDRFRHLSNTKVITTTVWEPAVLVLLMGEIYESRRWDEFRWHDIRTSFPEEGSSFQKTLRICPWNFMRCNAVITDGRDLWTVSLIWPQIMRYSY